MVVRSAITASKQSCMRLPDFSNPLAMSESMLAASLMASGDCGDVWKDGVVWL